VVKVSRVEAKRVRLEGDVTYIARNKVGYNGRNQKGALAEKLLLKELQGTAKDKRLILFVDCFGGAGDRLMGFYELLKETGGDADVLTFMLFIEHREHFYTVARTRLIQEAVKDFNKEEPTSAKKTHAQQRGKMAEDKAELDRVLGRAMPDRWYPEQVTLSFEELSVSGFCPLPNLPPAWCDKKPSRDLVLTELRAKLKRLTVTEDLDLVIPADAEIPVLLTAELGEVLSKVRTAYAPKVLVLRFCDGEDPGRRVAEMEQRFSSLAELENKCDIIATVRKSAYEIILATKKGKGKDFDINEGEHFLVLYNHSTSALNIDAESYLFGAGPGKILKEESPGFDPFAPSSVHWAFHRPGSKEALGSKEIDAEKANIFAQARDAGDLSMMTVANALRSHNAFPKGAAYGFNTTVDAHKKLKLKPDSSTLFAFTESPAIGQLNEGNIGAYLGIQQASAPERKWEYVKPVPVMWWNSTKSTLEPKQNSSLIRFATSKQIKLGIGQALRLS
jgi:hypothetical protein